MRFNPPHKTVVLVVDDQPNVLQLVATMLQHSGFEVLAAHSAESALSFLRDGRPDVLLTDVVMPSDMDGVDLALIARELCPELAVLFMSGFDEGRLERYRAKFGDACFLEKPFGMVELLSAVENALCYQSVTIR